MSAFPRRALWDTTALITRPMHQASALMHALALRGAQPIALPVIRVVPLTDEQLEQARRAVNRLSHGDIAVFVSINAAKIGAQLITAQLGEKARHLRYYAVGKATAKALNDDGFSAVWSAPPGAAGLLKRRELAAPLKGNVLIARGQGGSAQIGSSLGARGARIIYCELYRRDAAMENSRALRQLLMRGSVDIVVATSVDVLDCLLRLAGPEAIRLRKILLCTCSRRITQAAKRRGFACMIEANGADEHAICTAMEQHRAQSNARAPCRPRRRRKIAFDRCAY